MKVLADVKKLDDDNVICEFQLHLGNGTMLCDDVYEEESICLALRACEKTRIIPLVATNTHEMIGKKV